jgi:hypothetical protein
LFLASCKEEAENQKLLTMERIEQKKLWKADSSQIADLLQWRNGLFNSSCCWFKYSWERNKIEIWFFQREWFEFYYLMANLKSLVFCRIWNFKKVDSGFYQKIDRQACLIQTATYLKSVADKTNNQIMVYTMVDMDNKDGKIRHKWY